MNELRTIRFPAAVEKTRFQLFDCSIKLDLGIIMPDMHQALRIDERNLLRFRWVDPQNEIGIEIAYLEESHVDLVLLRSRYTDLSDSSTVWIQSAS